jgi:hypothetical protein
MEYFPVKSGANNNNRVNKKKNMTHSASMKEDGGALGHGENSDDMQ